MLKRIAGVLTGALLVSLMSAAVAGAVTIQTSDTSEPWQGWANAAQVPTWQGALPLTTSQGYADCGGWGEAAGCTSITPQVDQTTGQILPGPPAAISTSIALGDETDYEQGYFLHELGQVFWAEYLTSADEDQFMRIVGLDGDHTDWSNAYTVVVNGVTIHFPPYEWFAEGYRLCALYGINQPATANTFSDFGYPGLQPSFASRQRQVCQLIDQVGVDHGISTPAQATYPVVSPAAAPKPKIKPVVGVVHSHFKRGRRIRLAWGRRRIW